MDLGSFRRSYAGYGSLAYPVEPSRAVLYRFCDRVEPFLDDWHAQILAWAIFEKITIAELDG